jgi:hypothetical protein
MGGLIVAILNLKSKCRGNYGQEMEKDKQRRDYKDSFLGWSENAIFGGRRLIPMNGVLG